MDVTISNEKPSDLTLENLGPLPGPLDFGILTFLRDVGRRTPSSNAASLVAAGADMVDG